MTPEFSSNMRQQDMPVAANHESVNDGLMINGSQCAVVMYHYIRDVETFPSQHVVGLSIASFRAQLDRLCGQFEPIDWPTFFAWTQGRSSIPRRAFLTTFDDGLKDHMQTVAPILKEYGLRGVFFTPGRPLASQVMLAAHMLHLLLAQLGDNLVQQELTRYLIGHAPERDWWRALDQAKAERMYHYESISRAHLKYLVNVALPVELSRRALEHIFQQHIGSPTRWSRHWYLSWDDLAGMQSDGHTIGGHGYSHDPLAEMPLSDQLHDIKKTATLLHEGLGADLRPFSYPFGSFTSATADLVKQAGFVQAFSTRRHVVTDQDELFDLPRVDTIYVDAVIEEVNSCQAQ